MRMFKRRLQLAVCIVIEVLLSYFGSLTVTSMMFIYAASNTVGGVLEQVWQIDVGVDIALLYSFGVFACVPISKTTL